MSDLTRCSSAPAFFLLEYRSCVNTRSSVHDMIHVARITLFQKARETVI